MISPLPGIAAREIPWEDWRSPDTEFRWDADRGLVESHPCAFCTEAESRKDGHLAVTELQSSWSYWPFRLAWSLKSSQSPRPWEPWL